jgi:hypothetical protein
VWWKGPALWRGGQAQTAPAPGARGDLALSLSPQGARGPGARRLEVGPLGPEKQPTAPLKRQRRVDVDRISTTKNSRSSGFVVCGSRAESRLLAPASRLLVARTAGEGRRKGAKQAPGLFYFAIQRVPLGALVASWAQGKGRGRNFV